MIINGKDCKLSVVYNKAHYDLVVEPYFVSTEFRTITAYLIEVGDRDEQKIINYNCLILERSKEIEALNDIEKICEYLADNVKI